MHPEQHTLDWIASQEQHMIWLVEQWSRINSGSDNLEGLRRMRAALADHFHWLGGEMTVLPLAPATQINAKGEEVPRPLAEALSIRKRPEAPLQILLVGHMDTVFGGDHPFQEPRYILSDGTFSSPPEGEREQGGSAATAPVPWGENATPEGESPRPVLLNGPGVADLKGGLVVMLKALEALEAHPDAAHIGWQVLLNPDEEIGSIGSAPLLAEACKGKHLGLVYEPALADGSLAGARKGSGNFTLTVHGRAAHAGRNPEEGRNALVAVAELAQRIAALNGQREGVTFNPSRIEGGSPTNVVPDFALLRLNIRTRTTDNEPWAEAAMDALLAEINTRDGFRAARHGHFTRTPKPMSPQNQAVFDLVQACGAELGLTLPIRPSGGCCDGNNLWAHGLPNVDTLGVRGAHIHSDQEIVYLDSLVERAQLSALLLIRLAQGAWKA